MAITQLIYSSRHRPGTEDEPLLGTLRSIVSKSQRNNERDDVTGFLLFDRPWFFQILEGLHDQVVTTYNRIQTDPRHDALTLVALREVPARCFPTWSMGGVLRNLDQQEIFLRHGITGSLDPKRVQAATLLSLAMDLQDFEIERRDAMRIIG